MEISTKLSESYESARGKVMYGLLAERNDTARAVGRSIGRTIVIIRRRREIDAGTDRRWESTPVCPLLVLSIHLPPSSDQLSRLPAFWHSSCLPLLQTQAKL